VLIDVLRLVVVGLKPGVQGARSARNDGRCSADGEDSAAAYRRIASSDPCELAD